MPNGEFAARKLLYQRKHQRLLSKAFKRRYFNLKQKYDSVGVVPRAKGIVIKKFAVEQKQPSSGQVKCVRVQLVKNSKVIGAFVPGEHAIEQIDEHDEVTIEGLGGSQRGQMGHIPGMRYKVVEVNGTNIRQILKGKRDKSKR